MWIWVVIIVSAICAVSSFYMTYLAFSVGDRGAILFALFGMFFGVLFVTSAIKVAARKSAFFKRADIKMSGNPKPVSFVPHWFIVLALMLAGLGMLAAILTPLFFK
ncbi:MAG: hypothetical protein HY911_01610 [Desulfobacterales bacterium]|nr:hypothetical protein [Desulfobacterales bacterium]